MQYSGTSQGGFYRRVVKISNYFANSNRKRIIVKLDKNEFSANFRKILTNDNIVKVIRKSIKSLTLVSSVLI